jgi:hypothetical protein
MPTLQYIYENTWPKAGIRNLMVDMWALYAHDEPGLLDEAPYEFLQGLSSRFIQKRSQWTQDLRYELYCEGPEKRSDAEGKDFRLEQVQWTWGTSWNDSAYEV